MLPRPEDLLRNEDSNLLEAVRGLRKRVSQLERRANARTSMVNAGSVNVIVGTGNPFNVDDPFTGTAMLYPAFSHSSGNYHIIGMNAGVLQFGLSADDGKAYFAAGNAYIDVSGITLAANTYPSSAYIRWPSDDTDKIIGQIVGTYGGALVNSGLLIIGRAHDGAVDGLVYLNALRSSAALTDEGVNLVISSTGRVDLDLTPGSLTAINTKYLAIQSESSGTNQSDIILHLEASSSGTVANGFGVGMTYGIEDSAGNMDAAGYTEVVWTDKTSTSEDAQFNIFLMKAGTLTNSFTADPVDGITAPFGINVTNGHVRSNSTSINDDAATSFTPTKSTGICLVFCGGDSSAYAAFHYNTATPAVTTFFVGSNTNSTTGALTGTTGTDTKFTVSAHTDGKLYFENRRGGTRNIFVLLI